MHWLLDVHFEEDWCRIENKAVQQNLNMFRKAAINLIKHFKTRIGSKKAISNVMLDCLFGLQNYFEGCRRKLISVDFLTSVLTLIEIYGMIIYDMNFEMLRGI